MYILDRFDKTDNTDECLEKYRKIESKREELGDMRCNNKIEKLDKDYLDKDEI